MRIRILLIWLVLLPIPTTAFSAVLTEGALTFGRFGTVHTYQPRPHPTRVVLFVSGDGGWNLGVVDMARELAALDALVVGIDITHYLRALNRSKDPCLYPAAEFEALSKWVQKQLGFPDYIQPLLAGYSSGATLVYAVLVQAPANTFRAAISLGFCPDLPLTKAPCKGNGLEWVQDAHKKDIVLLPAAHLEAPWIVFQGDVDQVCNAEQARAFVRQVGHAEFIALPKVGHGFSVPKNWLPQLKQVFNRLSADSVGGNGAALDLPLIEVPPRGPVQPRLAVMMSGDGGWTGLDREVAGNLAAHGIGVVGLNSLKYFWKARTPQGASDDLAHLLDHYLRSWKKDKAVLIGYSLGADVLPFIAARLPADLRSRIDLIALLSPSRQTAFEFHISEWLGQGPPEDQRPIRPELDRITDLPVLCVFGEKETQSLCRDALPSNVTIVSMAGGHHMDGRYESIGRVILQALNPPLRR